MNKKVNSVCLVQQPAALSKKTNIYIARTAFSSASSEQLNPYLLKELLTSSQVPNSDRRRNSPGFARKQQSLILTALTSAFFCREESLRCPSSCTPLLGYLVHVLHVRLEIQITVSIHNSVSIPNTTSPSIHLYVWCFELRKRHFIPFAYKHFLWVIVCSDCFAQ